MSNSITSRVKLFPMLMVMATLAFGIRAIDIYTGVGLLNAPVQAQDQQEQESGNDDSALVQENEDAQSAIDETVSTNRAPIIVGLPDNEEMELITQLRQRRIQLESRETKLDLQQNLLASTENRINEKIAQLQVLEERIKTHLRLFEDKETEQLQSIVRIYETMKPKEAAPRFEALALQTQLDLVQLMNPRKVASLMEQMTPQKASTLTTELATKAQPPGINDIQGSN